jgi:hypothetical protein
MADDIRDDREIAVGSHIESCYTAIEAAIERIVISTDGATPAQGGRYHQDLIERAATENPGVRPAMISRPVANDLHDLRRFRHAKRRSYISRAQPNVAIAARAVPALRAEITAFAEQMKIKPIKRAKSVTTKSPRKSSRTPEWWEHERYGPIHTSKASRVALAASPWLTVEWLAKYAPELNDIERTWLDLKRHHLAHQTFRDVDALDTAIHRAAAGRNAERALVSQFAPVLQNAA